MKRARAADPHRRGGYVSLLAMSFALGLGVLGGALATGLRSYLGAAADQAREIRSRIALESAAATVLGEVAAAARLPEKAEVRIDSGRQRVVVATPLAKVDLGEDAPETIAEAGRAAGLEIDAAVSAAAGGLAEASLRHRLDASQEDCLRRVFTYGRGGAPRAADDELVGVDLRAGDQIDLRVHTVSDPGEVLWLRARFTGGETGWRIHDYRRLVGVTGRCI